MPLDFPSNPSVNQSYTIGTRKWFWNGKSWQLATVSTGTAAAGITYFGRTTVNGTTASIAPDAWTTIDITGYKGYFLYKVQTSGAAWVRIYTDSSSRYNDRLRSIDIDPSTTAGVIAEFLTTSAQTVIVAPAVIGFNNEATPTTNIPVSVVNKGALTSTITVTLTVVQFEA